MGRVEQAPVSYLVYRRASLDQKFRWFRLRLRHRVLRQLPHSINCGPRGEWNVRGGSLNIGAGMAVRADYYVYVQGVLSVGRGVFFNRQLFLSVFESVTIGNNVRFGERVSIHDENHVFEPNPVPGDLRNSYDTSPIAIEDNVWVGANCVILGGTSIGAGSVIAANSVVRGEIPPGVLAGGAPARVIRPLRAEVSAS